MTTDNFRVVVSERKPIKMWLADIEDGALEQAKNLANLPFVFRHIAIMPDAHQGYGMPIGGVMAAQGVIVPNAVGVDIGCGMCAVKTSLTDLDTDKIKEIMGKIRKRIPVGFNHHKKRQDDSRLPSKNDFAPISMGQYQRAQFQVGTLGGGNHFIEIQKGSDGHIWLMVHSGSRNIGHKVATYYNKLAIEKNEKWFSRVPKEWQLAFFPLDSDEGNTYKNEMNFCVEFAFFNRGLMMERIKESVSEVCGVVAFEEMINIAHNYAAIEHHFGKNVVVHRKGATKATEGLLGIIPGSQGTSSYIVKGRGNPESFCSCSHGAGRVMGRKQAQNTLDLDAEKKRLDDIGVIHSMRNKKDLDEAAGAYKDISIVMQNQTDLVSVEVELTPMAVIKG